MNRWFALATIAQVITTVSPRASGRKHRLRVFAQMAADAIAIQPKWKLGMAAYSFRMREGCA